MKSIHSRSHMFGKSIAALSVAVSTAAMAQGTSSDTLLDEVVITAEHREASLQKTQISVSAFDEKAIADRGISNSLDLAGAAPNMNVQPYQGGKTGVSFNIRGIGNAETLISFDPAVSVYLDGVLIAKNTGALLDVLELQRIEILRGPQGTLYGRNTMGGAVNYITKKPVDKLEGSIKATLGNYRQHDFKGMLNVPLLGADSAAGELDVRLSAGALRRGGIQKNVFAGAQQNEVGTRDRNVYMGQLQWQPTDKLSVLYTYDGTRIDEVPEVPWATNVNTIPVGFPGTIGRSLVPYKADGEDTRPDTIQIDHIGIANTSVDGHALDIRWELADNLTLESLTGLRKMHNFSENDSDGSPFNYIWTRDVQESSSLSQEFRLIGTALADRLKYSGGLFYMDDEGDLYSQTTALGGATTNIADFKNKAWAIYGQGTYDLTDRLDLTLGARYSKDDRKMGKAFFGTGSPVRSFNPPVYLDAIKANPALANNIYPEASNNFKEPTWLVSLGYKWTDDVMTYAKISTGYQAGGFNSRDVSRTDFVTGFKPEKLLSYELGVKSRWANRFQVNAAAFYGDYRDKRVNRFNPQTLASVQVNSGKMSIWGVELEMLAQLTDKLQAGINYGHIDPKYLEYTNIDPTTGAAVDLSKTSNFPFSPENTASANLEYKYPISVGLLKARVEWSYRDKMTFLTPQPERNSSGTLQLWNARLGLDEISGPGNTIMRVSAWGRNLADQGNWNTGVNIYDTFGFDINTYGEPRTYGMDLELKF